MSSNELRDLCEQSPDYVRSIAPYQPGKPISELAREYGLDPSAIVKLASNENPLGLSPAAKIALENEIANLARYPDGGAFDLKAALCKRYRVAQENIVVGNGSNDVLELAAAAFLAPGRSAVYSQHAFAVYPLATKARGSRGIAVPAKQFGHDLDAMAAAIAPDTRIVFMANPNNPTGTFAPHAEVERFLAKVPRNVLIVLDEAYNEYLPEALRFDTVTWLDRFPNLVIVRTFSKVYGLAGLRVGFGLMHPDVADLLNRVRQPFNVNNLALAAAAAALEDHAFIQKSFQLNRDGLKQLEAGARKLGLAFIPSVGNFITIEFARVQGNAQGGVIFEKLLRAGVIVRPVTGYEMPDHLRVTVGTPAENDRFLSALSRALGA
jgi:histidinol-phosphate aminotransferase